LKGGTSVAGALTPPWPILAADGKIIVPTPRGPDGWACILTVWSHILVIVVGASGVEEFRRAWPQPEQTVRRRHLVIAVLWVRNIIGTFVAEVAGHGAAGVRRPAARRLHLTFSSVELRQLERQVSIAWPCNTQGRGKIRMERKYTHTHEAAKREVARVCLAVTSVVGHEEGGHIVASLVEFGGRIAALECRAA
jgi:hypothetical protein